MPGFTLVSSVVAASTSGSGVTSSAIDTTGANALFMAVSWASGQRLTGTISDSKGNTWQLQQYYDQSGFEVAIYYCKPTSVGTGHTFTATASVPAFTAWAFTTTTGTFSVGPVSSGGAFSFSTGIGTVTPTQNNALIIAVGANEAGGTWSIDSGFTLTGDTSIVGGQHYSNLGAYLLQGTAAAVSPVISNTGFWHIGGAQAVFYDAAGDTIVSQEGAEVFGGGTDEARVSQFGAEVFTASPPANQTYTQLVAEVFTGRSATQRTTQLVLEVWTRNSPAGSSGMFFGDQMGGDIWID